jgi:hypothetical protein
MVRKLVSVAAVLFALGVAVLSKPALAAPVCDCDFCSSFPNAWCIDDDHGGWGMRCNEYSYFYCF